MTRSALTAYASGSIYTARCACVCAGTQYSSSAKQLSLSSDHFLTMEVCMCLKHFRVILIFT